MANIDFPRGLQVYGNCIRATQYKLTSNYAQDLFIGDPVINANTGYVTIATAGSTNAILGAIIGIYDLNEVPLQYWDTGHTGVGYVLVADSPEQLFVAQGDGDTTYLDFADRGGNINLNSGSGSTVNYLSGWELDDSATAGSDANAQVRLIKPVPVEGNGIGTANCDWIIRINNHQAGAGIVGAGI